MFLTAFVSWPSAPLTDSLVRKSLASLNIPKSSIISSLPEPINSAPKLLQWSAYDVQDPILTHRHRASILASAYTFRKALIRKHFLARAVHSYVAKYTDCVLTRAVPTTWEMEISFADELAEMWSDELYLLGEQLDRGNRWWILKPGMADRGMGLRIFNSKDDLQEIFEEFDGADEDTEVDDTAVITHQVRHFVIQEYLTSPLLLDPRQIPVGGDATLAPSNALQGHKFHLRAYCVASGALEVYLCPRILALFAAAPYSSPTPSATPVDLAAHLTNTSLQAHRSEAGVYLLDELVGARVLSGTDAALSTMDVENIVEQVAAVLAGAFQAAIQMSVHFQPLPNAFELFGVDLLVTHGVDKKGLQVSLLEFNAEPAIELTGTRLTWVLEDLFISIGKVCVEPFFANAAADEAWGLGETRHGLRKCLDVEVRGFE